MNLVELTERRERLRREALHRQLDGVLVYSWHRGALTWFTGYTPGFVTNFAALWLPAHGTPMLGVRHPYEVQRATSTSRLDTIGIARPAEVVPEQAQRVGLVGGDLAIDETPVALVAALASRGMEIVDLKDLVDEWRATKSPGDIGVLTKAAEIGRVALEAAGRIAQVGESDYEIAGRVEAAARKAGATRVLCLVSIGDGAVVTEAHGLRVGPQDPVGLEITLCSDGAWTQVNGTLLPEQPAEHQQRAMEVCRATRCALLEALRPGVAVDEVVLAGDRVLAEHGLLDAKEYDFGHGVGADTPEHPRLILDTNRMVELGSVIAVHVAIRRPGADTAFVGGPVLVEDSGVRELVPAAPWASS